MATKERENLTLVGVPLNTGAVGHYRIIQPMLQMAKDGDVPFIVHHNIRPADAAKAVHHADAVIFHQPMGRKEADWLDMIKDDPDLIGVFESDDNVWEIDPFSEGYATLGLKEVKVGKDYIWKDGENGFSIEANTERLKNFTDSLSRADLITAPTEQLAGLFEEQARRWGNKKAKAVALPNCLDLSLWEPTEIVKPKGEVRIVWQGGTSHHRDIESLIDPIAKFVNETPGVKFVSIGKLFPSVKKKFRKDKLIIDDAWTSFDAHPYRMKLTGADIGICPLVETPFSRCKSEVKFTEYSALGIPTVASNVLPYSPVITHGENGLLAKTPEQWINCLTQLIEDAQLRQALGSNARRWVEKERDANKNAKLWREAYQEALRLKKSRLHKAK